MEQKEKQQLKCPLCSGTTFKTQKGKVEGEWGMTAHMVNIKICETCSYVMLFSRGRSIWDID